VKGLYIVTDGVMVGMLLGEGAVYCDRAEDLTSEQESTLCIL
jgi:hypothetical protein